MMVFDAKNSPWGSGFGSFGSIEIVEISDLWKGLSLALGWEGAKW